MHRLFSVDFIHSSTTNVIFLHELLIRCVHTYVMVWNVPGLSFTKYLQIHVYKVDDTNMSWD